MNAIIITIGDELLYGQTLDTNSAWMGRELNLLGIEVTEVRTISDERTAILNTLKDTRSKAALIFITGGLGPTKDDITKNCLVEFFGSKLVRHIEIEQRLREFYSKRGAELPKPSLHIADIPSNCIALKNDRGTAWGMWFEEMGAIYVSMPGVPYEMEGLMKEEVLPRIREKLKLPYISHLHFLTSAVGETKLSGLLEDFEQNLAEGIKLAYLPGLGTVKLRLTAKGENIDLLNKNLEIERKKLLSKVGHYVYGEGKDIFEEKIGDLLKAKNWKLATAESCTGGYIAHRITSVAGSSAYYKGSVISYSNEIKTKELGVSERVLKQEGAVSEATVRAMLEGICKKYDTEIGIAVSGIAGPDGGSEEKPVGTVWVALGKADAPKIKKLQLAGNRLQNIKLTGIIALEMLRRYLLKDV